MATATTLCGEPPAKLAAPARKIAIIVSKGTLDMAYPALLLANAARITGIETTLFFTFSGLEVVTRERFDHLQAPAAASSMMKGRMARIDLPGVRDMLQILSDNGAHLYACGLAMEMFQLKQEELVPQVEAVVSTMEFFARTQGAQLLFI